MAPCTRRQKATCTCRSTSNLQVVDRPTAVTYCYLNFPLDCCVVVLSNGRRSEQWGKSRFHSMSCDQILPCSSPYHPLVPPTAWRTMQDDAISARSCRQPYGDPKLLLSLARPQPPLPLAWMMWVFGSSVVLPYIMQHPSGECANHMVFILQRNVCITQPLR